MLAKNENKSPRMYTNKERYDIKGLFGAALQSTSFILIWIETENELVFYPQSNTILVHWG